MIDPTGAGDTFAGGLVGYIAAHPGEELSDELLRRAMAHATVLASFNVEEFGTDRVARLQGEEIVARIHELHAMTQFSGAPLAAPRVSRERPRASAAAAPAHPGLLRVPQGVTSRTQ